ncbi:hypothetical protein K503DRAFT_870248 [Rhizopogon vinicolor AM-OR11-026]|uniref:Uncharacterized protein n=1 Tax=Rhizopogon vinicolor AM-OR11-026 TaxID=1314800 RepID=A0A1B7MI32_9AGAM|nr:hypothetical protein K503DRAFT_870248 [Rhizopogon vinicolor AM-OR11-026]
MFNYPIMTSPASTSNPPPYGSDTSMCLFLNDKGRLPQDDAFYKLVEEARQGFLASNDIMQYMAQSTFMDDPTPEAQQEREDDIRDFLRYNCPVVVGCKPAPSRSGADGGHSHDSLYRAEKVSGKEHAYLNQDMIDRWAEKRCPPGRRHLLTFLLKLILLREFTSAAWSLFSKKSTSGTPFSPEPDVWVSECGHAFVSYRRGKSRDPQSIVFINDEGGYIDIPAIDTPVLRRLASGDWSVFQRDVITSMGPYRKAHQKDYLERVWALRCACTGLGSGLVVI